MAKYSKLVRIYISDDINIGGIFILESDIYHYIKSVMKIRISDSIRVFNERNGEFFANIISYSNNKCRVEIINQYRKLPIVSDLYKVTLALCIIKHKNMIEAIRNAVQLGVFEITPIISERVQFSDINIEKINKAIIESTEQSERLSITKFNKPIGLKDFLNKNFKQIIFANELESEQTLSKIKNLKQELIALIGPEGGFTNNEIDLLKNTKEVISVSLSNNVLRSDTAVTSLISNINLMQTLLNFNI